MDPLIHKQAEKITSVAVGSSASALHNNLVVRFIPDTPEAVATAVIHRSQANIVPTPSAPQHMTQSSQVSCLAGNCSKPTSIMQVMFLETAKRTYFVVASTFGVQVFDEGGSVILFSHSIVDSVPAKQGTFAKGIAKLYDSQEESTWLCVGTHSGDILVFSVCGLDLCLSSTVDAHSHSVSSCAGLEQHLVTGDDSGAMHVWLLSSGGRLKKIASQQSCNWSCTSICIFGEKQEHHVIAAFGCGHLRIYKLESLLLCAEVAAHARWITAIDVSQSSLLCVSASEDSFIKVWQLAIGAQPISLLLSLCLSHHMVVGARFLNVQGSKVGFACYDSSELVCYNLLLPSS